MSNLQISVLLSVLTCLSACGRQVVEFKLDAAAEALTDSGITPDASVPEDASGVSDAGPGVPPVVTATLPVSGAQNVAPTESVLVTFSKAMNGATLSTSTFILTRGAVAVEGADAVVGAVTWSALTNTATFQPNNLLAPNTQYTAMVTTGARDTANQPLAANYAWSFTTAAPGAPPTVVFTAPVDNQLNVAVAARPSATFSGAMDPATLSSATFTVQQGVTPVVGVVAYDMATNIATFSPSSMLDPSLVYTAKVTTGAKSTTGVSLEAEYTWDFTTSTRPVVDSTLPLLDALAVPTSDLLFASFSKPMDSATLTTLTFTVMQGSTAVDGAVSWNGLTDTATFRPTSALAPNALHTAVITIGAADPDGLALATNYTWTFTTALMPAAPRVVFTTPADDAANVAVAARSTATFSALMNPSTLNASTFVLRQGATSVPGSVTYDVATNTATFSPIAALDPSLVYTATVTTGATSTGAVALMADHTWDFTTTARPMVASTVPAPGATSVPPNDSVLATFSKAMDASTITPLTFTLQQGTTSVPGVVSLNGATNTATFNPTAALGANLTYTATVTTGALDTGAVSVAPSHTWTFTTAAAPTAPTVALATPVDNATAVAVSTNLNVIFSRAMDASTINTSTITLKQGATTVTGVVTYNAATNTATFNPIGALSPNALYTAAVTTGAKDSSGLALTMNYGWSFTTNPAPTVLSSAPLAGAMDVPVNDSLSATFSRAMDATTINALTFSVTRGATSVLGLVSYDALTDVATFNPTGPLEPGALHTATITSGARDPIGQALVTNFVWTFTTAAPPPTVLSNTPANNSLSAPVTTRPTAKFNQPMDPSTITDLTFTLKQGLTPVMGMVGYVIATRTATFTPAQPLVAGLPYTATITTGARDSGNRPLASEHLWTFSTDACGQDPVVLGAAANFVVLGGSTVTNVVSVGTVITGDLGVSPGSAVTGFPPGILIGTEHKANPTSALAIAALTTAYDSAAGRTLCPVTKAGNLGGMTLFPGLYKSTSSLEISSGDLTLDAQGNEEAVFIFQMASTLTTSPGRQLILAGGAKAANIYWQVGTSATLGTTSVFHGTILADQAITLGTGASLDGRALAREAAVSLDANIIVMPAP